MKKSITFIFGAFLAFQATAQNDLWCKQHVVQAELPYSAEREQRMKDFDNEQKAIQQAMKQEPLLKVTLPELVDEDILNQLN